MKRRRPTSSIIVILAMVPIALAVIACGGDVTTQPSCPVTSCGGAIVDTRTDAANCGACGHTCANDEVCRAGVCACASSCPNGQILCGGRCITPESDPDHCGARGGCSADDGASPDFAGSVCVPGKVCQGGECTLICPPGQLNCDGACVDPKTHPTYCGADAPCVDYAVCASDEVCHMGTCQKLCPDGTSACPVGGALSCTDLATDTANCGQCGLVCGAGQACLDGACAGFARWDAAVSTATLSGGDLAALVGPGQLAVGTIGKSSGKWYWEILPTQFGGSGLDRSGIIGVGVKGAVAQVGNGVLNESGWGVELYTDAPSYLCTSPGTVVYSPTHYPPGTWIGVALDLDGGTLSIYVDGVSQGFAFTGLEGQVVFPIYANDGALYNNTEASMANFGASPFAYSAPVGFHSGLY